MNYYSNSELTNISNLLTLEINARKKMLSLYDGVIKLVKDSDSKRVDKRFIDKLQSIYKGLNVKKSFDFDNTPLDIDFIYYEDKRCIKAVNGEHYIYIKNDCFYMSNNHDYKTYKDGKINAVELVASLENMRQYWEKDLKQLTAQKKHLIKTASKWVEMVNTLKDFRDSVPPTIADYLKMYEVRL